MEEKSQPLLMNGTFVNTSEDPLVIPVDSGGPVVTSDLPPLYKESDDAVFNVCFNLKKVESTVSQTISNFLLRA